MDLAPPVLASGSGRHPELPPLWATYVSQASALYTAVGIIVVLKAEKTLFWVLGDQCSVCHASRGSGFNH